jgi:1-Cys peroxiredoxin 6
LLAIFVYSGRNFDEIIRVIDSLQLTAKYKVATPVNWTQGTDCMLTPGVKEEEYGSFPKGVTIAEVPSGKKYLRITPQPDH